jgi:hypothetical protein
MMPSLIELTYDLRARSIDRALVSNSVNRIPQAYRGFTAGDQLPVRIRITDGVNSFVDLTSSSLRFGIGPISSRPEGGSLTYNDGTSTATIPYDSTPAQVKTLLDAMNSGAGAYSKGAATVTGQPLGPWFIELGAVGAVSLPTLNGTGLTPVSMTNAAAIEPGDSETAAKHIIRAFQRPVVYAETFSVGGGGEYVDGVLNFGTEGVYSNLPDGVGQFSSFAELELTDSSGNISTISQQSVIVRGEVVGQGVGGNVSFSPYITAGDGAAIFLEKDKNLSDLLDAEEAQENLGLFDFPILRTMANSVRLDDGNVTVDDNATLRISEGGVLVAFAGLLADQGGETVVASKWNTSSQRAWSIGFTDAGLLKVVLSADGGDTNVKTYQSVDPVLDGGPHTAGFSYDETSDVLKVYLDGVELEGEALLIVDDEDVDGIHASTAAVRIGITANDEFQFTGRVYALSIDSTPLTDNDFVNFHANGPIGADVLELEPGNIQQEKGQWLDNTVNQFHGLQSITGCTPAVTPSKALISVRGLTIDAGAVDVPILRAGDVLPSGYMVDSVYFYNTGANAANALNVSYFDGTNRTSANSGATTLNLSAGNWAKLEAAGFSASVSTTGIDLAAILTRRRLVVRQVTGSGTTMDVFISLTRNHFTA